MLKSIKAKNTPDKIIGKIEDADGSGDDVLDKFYKDGSLCRFIYVTGNILEIILMSSLTFRAVKNTTVLSVAKAIAPFFMERISAAGIKKLIKRERPPVTGSRPARLNPNGTSFPSEHSSSAFLSATLLSFEKSKLPVFAAAGFIAFSRVWCRVHFLSDVIAGGLLGVGAGMVIDAYEKSRVKKID